MVTLKPNKKHLVVFLIVVLLLMSARFLLEIRMNNVANFKIHNYCNKNNLPFQIPKWHKKRNMELIRSIYDYTVYDRTTHRIRIYITIFGQCEQHALVE
jgi:hypothetical protein